MRGLRLFRLMLALAALVAALFVGGSARADAPLSILKAFQANGAAIPACEFSEAQLEAGLRALPPDFLQYGTGLVDALHQALLARASGACNTPQQNAAVRAQTGVGGRAPAFPTALGSVTAATDAGLPAPLLALLALAGGLALSGAIAVLVHARGWDPAWAASMSHAWREAGYRAAGAWAGLRDRARDLGSARSGGPRPAAGAGPRRAAALGPRPASTRALRRSLTNPGTAISESARVRTALAAVLLVVGAGLAVLSNDSAIPAHAKNQQSVIQDDDHLLYSSTAIVQRTMGIVAGLGVDRVRVTVKWSQIAPDPQLRTRPHFDATDPAAYPPAAWVIYDRVLRIARSYGIQVDFNVTAPGPLWAMGATPTTRVADHYAPSARELGLFVAAVARRYSGAYTPSAPEQSASLVAGSPDAGPLPRVTHWSIWNEPNQPGWLAPQWSASAGASVPTSPRLYRAYVNEAVAALDATGHPIGKDTVLIGELAPAGSHTPGAYTPMTPMQFVRALYCVGATNHPLSGQAATVLGCPARVNRQAFVANNPGLFEASGFAHHPYDLFDKPSFQPRDPDIVTLSTISRLSGGLDRIFSAYGVGRQIPLYVTEYGYQTNPPDPYQVVSPDQQAVYLDQAAYMAWSSPRIRSFAQFLIYDAGPDAKYPPGSFKHWDTFQTGLLFANGKHKPAFTAYRLPIWLPSAHTNGAGHLLLWGQLRFARSRSNRQVRIEWRKPGHTYSWLENAGVTDPQGYFTTSVHPPGAGWLRITWRGKNGFVAHSRGAQFTTS